MTPLRFFIFDLDGTLLDSKNDIASAIIHVLATYSIEGVSKQEIFPKIGRPLRSILQDYFCERIDPFYEELLGRYLAYYRPRLFETTTLFDGVSHTLEQLNNRGIRMAVATSKSTATAKIVCSHFGLDRFVSIIQGTDDGIYKPDPRIVHSILNAGGAAKDESLMVGDTDLDIEAGRQAGIRTCGVTHGAMGRAALASANPDHLIDTFDSLLDLI